MCHTWGLACLPDDLHVGLPHDVLLVVQLVDQHGGELDPKCGTSILLFILDRVLLMQVSGL